MNEIEDNKVWISFNDYNCIKETKNDKFVILNESTFIEKVEETLDKWEDFFKKRGTFYKSNIEKIEINYSDTYDFMKPTIEIKLTDDYEIFYQYGINIKIEDFIRGAIQHLKNNPVKLKNWHYPNAKKIHDKLNILKEKMRK